MKNYQQLTQQYQKISHFNHLGAICGWDQATMMPAGGNDARASAMAELSGHVHSLATAPQLGELFENAESESLNATETASLREMKRQWQLATVLPGD